jgi:hypothetical protein
MIFSRRKKKPAFVPEAEVGSMRVRPVVVLGGMSSPIPKFGYVIERYVTKWVGIGTQYTWEEVADSLNYMFDDDVAAALAGARHMRAIRKALDIKPVIEGEETP